jgi:hypothetical protein
VAPQRFAEFAVDPAALTEISQMDLIRKARIECTLEFLQLDGARAVRRQVVLGSVFANLHKYAACLARRGG